MRQSRVNRSNERGEKSSTKRSLSTTGPTKIPGLTVSSSSKRLNAPFLYSESYEKSSSIEFTLDSSGFCKYCSAPRDYELKILLTLDDISSNLNSILAAYSSWDHSETPKFKASTNLSDFFSNDSEITKRMQNITQLCNKVAEIIKKLTADIEALSISSPWKNVSLHKPAPASLCTSLQETLLSARRHLNYLKSNTALDLFEDPGDSLARCLQLELQESWRERRALEVKVLSSGNQSSENVVKVLERVIQEHM